MVERSLLFLWAEVQTFDIVQERNIFANPNFYAKTPTKKQRRLPFLVRMLKDERTQQAETRIANIFLRHLLAV